MDVGVVGAGICGLTTAVHLLERGHRVSVYAERLTPLTTSNVAAALFFPHLVEPSALVLEAARHSFETYARIANRESAGVQRMQHLHIASTDVLLEETLLRFAQIFPDFAEVDPAELPGGYKRGWSMTSYFVDSRRFMPYLMGRLEGGGAAVKVMQLASRRDVLELPHDAIVNCSGLGARALFEDEALRPVKGQVLYLKPQSLDQTIVHDRFYIFPRADSCVLGGSHELDEYDLTPSEAVSAEILAGNQRILPHISPHDVIGVNTGLRPFRAGGPRLEAEEIGGRRVVHNYGHGGSGWTLAWGCAQKVGDLL